MHKLDSILTQSIQIVYIYEYFCLQLDQPTLGLSREYIMKGLDDPIVKGYHEYMVDVAVILGADRTTATEQLYESLLFEIALANVS